MKNLKYVALIALALTAGSCKKSLIVNPKNQIDSSLALTSLSSVNNLLNSVYSKLLSSEYYGNSMKIVPDIMADNIYPIPGLNSNRLILESTNSPRAHINLWKIYTGEINLVNIIINKVSKFKDSESEKKELLGQAYGLRGLFYWDLVKLYGYNPLHIINNFDLGVPLMLTPIENAEDVTFSARNTVQEVYVQIEKDLLAAEVALEGSKVAQPAYMSQLAVRSILAKVYLYWGKYKEAATYATKVINAKGNTLVSKENYANMFFLNSNPESLLELLIPVNQGLGPNSLQSYYATYPEDYGKRADKNAYISDTERQVGYGDFTPTPELLALYEQGDVRRDVIVKGRKGATDIQFVRKWPPTLGVNFTSNIPIMRISEMFLIRSEANIKGGSSIGASAQEDLDKIRLRAGLTSVPVSMDAIMKERRIELAFEGDRWFDLVRLGMDIPKSSALGNLRPIAITDYRILSPIPPEELLMNPNLKKNEGY